jgi:glycolate oxidase FAD binding subunit
MTDLTISLKQQITNALSQQQALRIQGNNTKAFYGNASDGKIISTSEHVGIIDYHPSELVITARSGTLLSEIKKTLAQHGQCLAFEPPAFGENATIGGTVACGLSGPSRPWAGAVRDHLLGAGVINGKAEILHFGGQVMKNVAGYDAFRLMAGAMGTLGLILDVSLKALPAPEYEETRVFEITSAEALEKMATYAALALPLNAISYYDGQLFLRFSGPENLTSVSSKSGGEIISNHWWEQLREQQLDFFSSPENLWRLSLPANTGTLDIEGEFLLDWAGQQRWYKTDLPAEYIRETVHRAGGHATLFKGIREIECFHSLSDGLFHLHQRLKKSFDPAGIFNPARLYKNL